MDHTMKFSIHIDESRHLSHQAHQAGLRDYWVRYHGRNHRKDSAHSVVCSKCGILLLQMTIMIDVIGLLLFALITPPITCQQYVEIKYFPATSVSETCKDICEYNGYECYDNVLQETDCQLAALETCGRNSITDESHAYQCDKGGCYVDCGSGVYADRGQRYLTCYSSPICHSISSHAYSFTKICTCAVVTNTPPKALHVYLWELIGMAALLLFLVGAAISLTYYFFPGIFPSWFVILCICVYNFIDVHRSS